MSPSRETTIGATMASASFSSLIGTPNLATRVRAPADTINRCNSAGGKTRRAACRPHGRSGGSPASVRAWLILVSCIPVFSGRAAFFETDCRSARPGSSLLDAVSARGSAKKSASPKRETVRNESHAALAVFERDLLRKHDVSDRQLAHRHETQAEYRAAFFVNLADVHPSARIGLEGRSATGGKERCECREHTLAS